MLFCVTGTTREGLPEYHINDLCQMVTDTILQDIVQVVSDGTVKVSVMKQCLQQQHLVEKLLSELQVGKHTIDSLHRHMELLKIFDAYKCLLEYFVTANNTLPGMWMCTLQYYCVHYNTFSPFFNLNIVIHIMFVNIERNFDCCICGCLAQAFKTAGSKNDLHNKKCVINWKWVLNS